MFTLILSIVLLAALKWREDDGKRRVAVIVLGDLGRSPRMQYHALSLCREGYDVEFVGYGGIASNTDCVVIHTYASETWQPCISLSCSIQWLRNIQSYLFMYEHT